MAWVTVPNPNRANPAGRWLGMRWLVPDEEECVTSAVDGMHELRRFWRENGRDAYYDHYRVDCSEEYVGRYEDEADAIAEWRRMLREGEL